MKKRPRRKFQERGKIKSIEKGISENMRFIYINSNIHVVLKVQGDKKIFQFCIRSLIANVYRNTLYNIRTAITRKLWTRNTTFRLSSIYDFQK